MFDDVLGPGRKEQATRRESKKNQKKGIKRTLKPESTTSIVHFFKKHAVYIAPLSCDERHLLSGKKEVFQWENEVSRHSSIMLARIRCDNPDLSANLFARGMAESPSCTCGTAMETSEHYLLKCPRFTVQRNKILNSPNRLYFNFNTIKYGNQLLKGQDRVEFYNAIQQFIIDTERFN